MKRILHAILNYACLLLILAASAESSAQTNPSTGTLPLTFNGGTSLPGSMAIHRFGAIPTTRTTADGTADMGAGAGTSGGYAFEGTSGVDGVSMLASGSQQAGGLIAEFTTLTLSNISVSYIAWTVLDQASRTNSIALQYRVGDSGTWINVDNPSSSVYATSTVGRSSGTSFSQVLPAGANNKAIVQVRWVYWESAGSTGSRDRLGLDQISITGTAPGPTITGAATATAFTTTYGTASASQNFSVSGSGLTANITATAPTGYEVSNGGAYGTSTTFTQSGGSASGTLSVRLAATAAVGGSYNSQTIALTSTGATTVNITTAASGNTVAAKGLTITGLTGSNKVYDATNTASFTGTAAYSGLANGETFSVTGTPAATFANANIGTGKTITVTGYTAPSGNYTLTQPSLSGNITAVNLTITGLTANDKIFDGNTTATLSGTAALSGVVPADNANVTLTGSPTATFASSAVGSGIAVTVTGYSLTGSASGNYTLSQPSGLTASIISSGLTDQTITFNPLANVTYGDANFNLTATSDSGLTVAYASSDTNVATVAGNVVTIVGPGTTTITASQAGNGSYNPAPNVQQNLTVLIKALTVSGAVASNKQYDRTTAATITGATLVGIVGSDVVTVSGGGTFADANIGTAKPVTAALSLGGANAAKYMLTQPSGLTADITAKALTITGVTANNKQYDFTTTATLSGTAALSGVVSGDGANVVLGGSPAATFATPNVGTGIAVTVSGYSISGSASGNYTLTQPTGLTANITTKALTITGLTGNNKTYDATVAASVSGTAALSGVVSGDEANVSLAGTPSATFATATVGTNKPITATGYSLSGSSATNYTLSQPTGLTGNITAKAITVSGAVANNKVYNGTTAATLSNTGTLSGVETADIANVSVATAAVFASANVGTGIAVTLSLTGSAASNYSLTQPGITADITKADQTITFNALPAATTATAPINLNTYASSSAGLTLAYASSNPAVATVSGNTLTIVGVGTTLITASQAGDSNHNAATDASQSLTVTLAPVVISQWVLTANGNPSSVDANVTAGNFTATGTSVLSYGATGAFADTWSTGALSTGKYFEVSITPHTGYTVLVKDVNFSERRSGTGIRDYQVRWSTNNFSSFTTIATVNVPDDTNERDGSISGLSIPVAEGQTLKIRWYGYNAEAAGGTWRINDSSLNLMGNVLCKEPSLHTVTGGGTYCAGGSGFVLGLDGSETGVNYQLQRNGSDTGTPVPGTGAAISFGAQTAAGTYTVIASNTNGSCNVTKTMTGNAVINVDAAPVGGTLDGSATVCVGSNSGTLTLGGHSGTIVKWQSSTVSDFSSNVTDIAVTINSLNYTNVSVTTYYRVELSNGVCPVTHSSVATITVQENLWTGAVDTNWNEAGNWSCNLVPSSAMNITIQDTANQPVISSDVSVNSLTLDADTSLTVEAGYDLTIINVLTVNATAVMTIENNANLIQQNDVSNSGDIVVKRNSSALKRQDYTLWSSPVAGQNLLDFSPLTLTTRFYTYNVITNLYNAVDPAATDFTEGAGYLIRVPNNHPTTATVWGGTFTGVPNNGDVSLTMTDDGDGKRFNLIGNPYPSPIDMTAFAGANPNITGTLYFWRKTNNALSPSYCSWTAGTFVDNGEDQVVDPQGIIQTGQGFFVEANGNGTAVGFDNDMRVGNNTGQFFRSTQETEKSRIWLNAANAAGAFSQMALVYAEGANSNGVDAFDGRYINDGEIALNSMINDMDYVVQGRAPFIASDVVPLRFKATTAGNYTIAIDHVDGLFEGSQDIFLRDNNNGTIHDLKSGAYSFASEAGTFASRFDVIYENALGVHPVFGTSNIVVYKQQQNLVVNTGNVLMASVKVYDLRGRLLVEKTNINASETTINAGATNQVLILQITSTDNAVVTKKVVN